MHNHMLTICYSITTALTVGWYRPTIKYALSAGKCYGWLEVQV